MRYFCNDALRDMVRIESSGGTLKAWADQNKVPASYLSDFLNGRRDAGPAILRALGFDEMPYYRKAD